MAGAGQNLSRHLHLNDNSGHASSKHRGSKPAGKRRVPNGKT
jgi:hypothetical protein